VALDAAETRRAHGLATTVEEEQARRQRAQAKFNVVRAKGAERSAYTALVATMGIEPTAQIAVADSSESPLPTLDGDLDAQVREALANQPDIRIAVEASEALHADVQQAKAAFYPQIALDAQVYQNIGALSTDGSSYYRVNDPGANVTVTVSVPIFDGGQRSAHLGMMQSEWSASVAAVERVRIEIRRAVTEAHDALETNEAEYQAALAVEEAASVAHDAALDAYRQGVGTYTDLVNTETSLTQAKTEKATAHANVLSSTAALVFALGRMPPSAR
jgi:outer membrane protein TolC